MEENVTLPSPAELKMQLSSNPSYILNFIMDLNPSQVMANLNGMGFEEVVDEHSAFEKLVDLYESKEHESLILALNVPFNPEDLPEAYHPTLIEVAQTNSNKPGLRTFQFLGEEMDASNILGAIAGGLTGLYQGGATSITNQQQQQMMFQQQMMAEQQRRQQQRTMYIVLIVAAILVIAFFIWKSKKG